MNGLHLFRCKEMRKAGSATYKGRAVLPKGVKTANAPDAAAGGDKATATAS